MPAHGEDEEGTGAHHEGTSFSFADPPSSGCTRTGCMRNAGRRRIRETDDEDPPSTILAPRNGAIDGGMILLSADKLV